MAFGNKKDKSAGRLAISQSEQGGATVVKLGGEVDLNVSPVLRDHLKSLVQEQRKVVVLDMSDVPYIDSSGVATLVECLQGVSRYGGVLRLAALGDRTRSVFEISRLDSVFAMRPTVEEAIKG